MAYVCMVVNKIVLRASLKINSAMATYIHDKNLYEVYMRANNVYCLTEKSARRNPRPDPVFLADDCIISDNRIGGAACHLNRAANSSKDNGR